MHWSQNITHSKVLALVNIHSIYDPTKNCVMFFWHGYDFLKCLINIILLILHMCFNCSILLHCLNRSRNSLFKLKNLLPLLLCCLVDNSFNHLIFRWTFTHYFHLTRINLLGCSFFFLNSHLCNSLIKIHFWLVSLHNHLLVERLCLDRFIIPTYIKQVYLKQLVL